VCLWPFYFQFVIYYFLFFGSAEFAEVKSKIVNSKSALVADAAVVPAGGSGDVFAAEPDIAGQDA
jgi:hypothetical protein